MAHKSWYRFGLLAITLIPFCVSSAQESSLLSDGLAHAQPYGWANPLDGGAIDTLAIVPQWTALDLNRLTSHLEMNLDSVLLDSRTQPGDDARAEAIIEALKDDPDLIILANFDLGVLSPDACDRIAEAVRGGAGLLLAHDGEAYPQSIAQLMSEATPADPTPDFESGTGYEAIDDWRDFVLAPDTWQVGEGRITRLNYRGTFPHTHALLPTFTGPGLLLNVYSDVYLAYLVRAALWTCDRAMKAEIQEALYLGPEFPDDAEIPPLPEKYIRFMKEQSAHQPVLPYILKLAQPTDGRYDLVTRLRELSDRPPLIIEAPDRAPTFAKGVSAIPFYMFDRAERTLADAWLLRRGRVAGSWSGYVDHAPRPRIEGVQFSHSVLRSYGAVEAAVTLSFPLHRPRPAAIFLQVATPDGRIVGEGSAHTPANDGTIIVRAPLMEIDAHRVTVALYVLESESNEDIESAVLFAYHRAYSFPVLHETPTKRFGLYLDWPRAPELNTSIIYDAAHDLGVRGVLVSGAAGSAFLAEHAGLEAIVPALPSPSPWPSVQRLREAQQAAALRGIARVSLTSPPPTEDTTDPRTAARTVVVSPASPYANTMSEMTQLIPLPNVPDDLPREQIPQFASWSIWNALLSGYDGVVHPQAYGMASEALPQSQALINPMGTRAPVGDSIAAALNTIDQGFDILINKSVRPFTGLAILGEQSNERVAIWRAQLYKHGLVPDSITTATIEQLTRDRYRVAIIPTDTNLDTTTKRQIARFAAEGGAIIAEGMPNLDYAPILFGVDRAGDAFTPTDAVPLDHNDATYGYYNTSGAAPTLLLAHPFTPENKPVVEKIVELLAELGARHGPHIDIDTEDIAHTQIYAFAVGSGGIFVALPNPSIEKGPKITFAIEKDSGALYPMSDPTAIPHAQRKVRARPNPGEPTLVAWLPYEVEGITLAAVENVIASARLHVTVRIEGSDEEISPDGHVVALTFEPLTLGEGMKFHKAIRCGAGLGKDAFALPRNLSQGYYTLRARDLLTGLDATTRVHVLPPNR